MKKALYSLLASVIAGALLVAAPNAASAAVYTEGFDTAVPNGWAVRNNSTPTGSEGVFQGNTTVFSAHQGPAGDAYAAMNFNAAGGGGNSTISLWLITPRYETLSNDDEWSFFTRIPDFGQEVYPDRLEVRMSTNGSCNPGTGATSTGDFGTLLETINPDLTKTGYPKSWTKFGGKLAGIRGAKSGCFAFRYFVTNAGPVGTNSDYIGIDTYSYDDQPTDTTPPTTSILSGSDGPTRSTTQTFTFESSEAGSTFECALDDAEFGACSGPGASHTTAALDDGVHTFSVRATDLAGNTDSNPPTRTFTVDTTAPTTTIVTGPEGDTNDTAPTFTFESSEPGSTFECAIDDAAFAACSGPDAAHATAVLDEGAHAFSVRATDAVGNTEPHPTTRTFTVDITAPTTTILTGPEGDTQSTTPTFTFESNEPGSTFECAIDDAAFAACSGADAAHATAVLEEGAHAFSVRATDAAGNTDPDPATRTFTVDITAPTTTILTGPEGETQSTTPTFTFESNEPGSTFECAIDDAAFAACSGPGATHIASTLGLATHVFAVRATDAAGNTNAAPTTRTFKVVAAPIIAPKPKACSAEKAAVTRTKAAVTQANHKLKSANKSLKSAKKALKKAKKHKSAKTISQAKKKVSKANKKVKQAKLGVKKAKRNLTSATAKLKNCQR